jgi:hypothetical protein
MTTSSHLMPQSLTKSEFLGSGRLANCEYLQLCTRNWHKYDYKSTFLPFLQIFFLVFPFVSNRAGGLGDGVTLPTYGSSAIFICIHYPTVLLKQKTTQKSLINLLITGYNLSFTCAMFTYETVYGIWSRSDAEFFVGSGYFDWIQIRFNLGRFCPCRKYFFLF